MTDEIAKIVAALPAMTKVTGVWATAEERLARGDAAFVADLGIALAGPDDPRMWQARSVRRHLLRLLAFAPGVEAVSQTLRLVSAYQTDTPELGRHGMELLAACHPAGELAAAFSGGDVPADLRACLVQELVLRKAAVEEIPGVRGWLASPDWLSHPLSWLPLTLRAVEGEPPLPQYSVRGRSVPFWSGIPKEPGVPSEAATRVTETTTDVAAALIAAAVANWAEESRGRVEARTYALAGPLGGFAELGLACLEGKPATIVPGRPDRAWRLLFSAASTGGAYNSGLRGAYGRLAAWRSLAGLSAAPEGATAAEVEERAGQCAWFTFGADSGWFKRIAWDIGLAAVTSDGQTLSVLAATDSN
ncbi:hypothetical protein Aph01nite_40530 [Acrocarpospora phusangensis]|uniref:Uncharacterized protein n=1 Tax=Acrocarpospora phusangensis TaxID=1070424 RepID=A0A919UPV3_9ACTN|nr:DUF6183 family protein [Acrocarpospora phusangensis]GIH25743.1 hypothetical protein Aph01nite_40530 [Acrocarpospora phusangensis]